VPGRGFYSSEFWSVGEMWCTALGRGFDSWSLIYWLVSRGGVVLGHGVDSFEVFVNGVGWCSAWSWVRFFCILRD
jgi:hypothetical protein